MLKITIFLTCVSTVLNWVDQKIHKRTIIYSLRQKKRFSVKRLKKVRMARNKEHLVRYNRMFWHTKRQISNSRFTLHLDQLYYSLLSTTDDSVLGPKRFELDWRIEKVTMHYEFWVDMTVQYNFISLINVRISSRAYKVLAKNNLTRTRFIHFFAYEVSLKDRFERPVQEP